MYYTLKQKLANHENPIISIAAVKCESKKKQAGDRRKNAIMIGYKAKPI